jgi:NADH:ubiquinone oxidoreductase subunit E
MDQIDGTAQLQPALDRLVTDVVLRQVDRIITNNKGKAGAAIRVLQQAQELIGYLPPKVLETISSGMKIPPSELYGIVSFYHFFSLVPKGKHVIQVCMGTSCYVKGGEKLLKTLKKDQGLESGGITIDGSFSLEIVRCLGCCGLSPVMGVGTDVHRKVRSSQLKDILSAYR